MANIWNATLEPNNNVKQNTFDWTHVNNLTTQIGRITPIQCELVPAKTSFRVKPIPALQLMPMVFPVQTRMRASIAYFRYPLRALWKDYKDFIGNFREGLEEPYHNFNNQSMIDKMLGTGGLMDYLGVPTTVVGKYGVSVSYNDIGGVVFKQDDGLYTYDISDGQGILAGSRGVYDAASYLKNLRLGMDFQKSNFSILSFPDTANRSRMPVGSAMRFSGLVPADSTVSDGIVLNLADVRPDDENQISPSCYSAIVTDSLDADIAYDLPLSMSFNGTIQVFKIGFTSEFLSYLQAHPSNTFVFYILFNPFKSLGQYIKYNGSVRKWAVDFIPSTGYTTNPSNGNNLAGAWTVSFSLYSESTYTDPSYSRDEDAVHDLVVSTSPYYNSNSPKKDKQIKLSAYAARAYEGIYNSFYRDNRNNPYYINGVVQYNQWIPTYEGGADTTPYELRYANWEKDFLTTAVQSPQQGNAPLVGITTYEQVSSVNDEQGNPTTTVQTKVAMVDEDGKRYSLEFDSDNEELKNVKYVELDNGTAVRSVRSLFDLVTSGISITDLRNVNAYQKFLELNMRKGYSYKEIIEGRFDVKVRYADLLLPEFFGGFSRDINMNSISQTVDQTPDGEGAYKDVLGSQAGVGYFRGGSDANIECFCDEESIIMGLLVITPLPVYTQLLPKHFLYRGLLDHFNPEFNNISFQPITYKEVCPIQAWNSDESSLTQTFGYQRPWYEYCQRYDQAHGLFRTDLSNFLMHRVFNQKPELARSFLTIDPEQVTDVFSVTDVTDKVYGQILIECTVKLPVARVAIPRLD